MIHVSLKSMRKQTLIFSVVAILVVIVGLIFLFLALVSDEDTQIAAPAADKRDDNPQLTSNGASLYEWVVTEKLSKNNVAGFDLSRSFPADVVMNDNILVLAHPHESEVDVFERDNTGQWVLIQEITEADIPGNNAKIRSNAVAVQDDTMVIVNEFEGVYIFESENGHWVFQQTISQSTLPESITHDNNRFGKPIFISNDVFILPEQPLRIFERQAGQWQLKQEITKSDLPGWVGKHYTFGKLVATQGNILVVADANNAVYIFEHDDQWELKQIISEQSHPQLELRAGKDGWSMAIDENVLVIGVPLRNIVYIFRKANDQWVFEHEISRDSLPPLKEQIMHSGDAFGKSVAVKGDLLAVTDPWIATYIFKHDGSQWVWEQSLPNKTMPGDENIFDYWRSPVFLNDKNLLVIDGVDTAYIFGRQPGGEQSEAELREDESMSTPGAEDDLPLAAKKIEEEMRAEVKAFAAEWQSFLNDQSSPLKQLEAIESRLLEIDTQSECEAFDNEEYSITYKEVGQLIDRFEERLEYFEDAQGLESKIAGLVEQYLEAAGYEENDFRLDYYSLAKRIGFRDVYVDVMATHYEIEDKGQDLEDSLINQCHAL